MLIGEIHSLFKSLADQSQQGYYTHEEIDQFLDRASMWLFSDLRKTYGEGIDTHESMSPFVGEWEFYSDDFEDGVLIVPQRLQVERLSVLFLTTFDNKNGAIIHGSEVVNADELPYRLKSQLNPVTIEYPLVEYVGKNRYRIYPEDEHTGRIKYLRRPKKPLFKYTKEGRVDVQDVENSIDLEWGEGYLNQVIYKAIALAGFNLNSEVLIQAGLIMEQKKP